LAANRLILMLDEVPGELSAWGSPSLGQRVNRSEVAACPPFETHPVAHARHLQPQAMSALIDAGQFAPQ
jgi:hypothetical protein